MSPLVISVLLSGSLLAGWVDAVIGGGGLILIPLVMIMNPGFSNAQALGVNKVAAIFGTGSSAVTLSRKVPSVVSAICYAPLALLGSALGATIAASVDKQIMRPVIIVLLIAVGCFVLFRPTFGENASEKVITKKSKIAIICAIGAISSYDGLFGPGTGLFLIMGLTSILGKDFITSAAWAKVINVFTNLGALITFAIQGEVLWILGIALAVTNVIGAQVGARMVLSRGSSFIRVVMMFVVVAMAAKLSLDQLGISLA